MVSRCETEMEKRPEIHLYTHVELAQMLVARSMFIIDVKYRIIILAERRHETCKSFLQFFFFLFAI